MHAAPLAVAAAEQVAPLSRRRFLKERRGRKGSGEDEGEKGERGRKDISAPGCSFVLRVAGPGVMPCCRVAVLPVWPEACVAVLLCCRLTSRQHREKMDSRPKYVKKCSNKCKKRLYALHPYVL